MKETMDFIIDDDEALKWFTNMMDQIRPVKEQVIDQAIQGDGPIPRQLDIFKSDMDYACERYVLRGQARMRLMIDTETGELV